MPLPRLSLYRHPEAECSSTGYLQVFETSIETWQVPSIESQSFDLTFEQIIERLSQVPRIHTEPDGSFVWCGHSSTEVAWQLYGMIYDRAERVVRIELTGECPQAQWLQLLDCLHPNGELIAFVIEFQRFVLARDLVHLLAC